MAGVLGDEDEPQTRTVVETQVTTLEGQPTTVRETVTTAPATTSAPTTNSHHRAPSDASGEELTDQATALLGQGRWAEAEAAARQALTKLEGSGELYEAYASYDLGRALVEQGRCDEALPTSRSLGADPGQPEGDPPGAQALLLTLSVSCRRSGTA